TSTSPGVLASFLRSADVWARTPSGTAVVMNAASSADRIMHSLHVVAAAAIVLSLVRWGPPDDRTIARRVPRGNPNATCHLQRNGAMASSANGSRSFARTRAGDDACDRDGCCCRGSHSRRRAAD